MTDVGLNVLASNQTLTWDDAAIPWRNIDSAIIKILTRQDDRPGEQYDRPICLYFVVF